MAVVKKFTKIDIYKRKNLPMVADMKAELLLKTKGNNTLLVGIMKYRMANSIGNLMNKNWEAQKKLHPLMLNPIIEKTEKIAFDNGAIGFKCNGAGGGGSASIMADIGKENLLKRQLIKAGFQLLSAKLDFMGVQTWKA